MSNRPRVFVCFDDTDNIDAPRGTGKLARWYAEEIPEDCSVWGVVRQQLLVHPAIPYTSHNSSACVVVLAPSFDLLDEITERAIAHVERHALEGSDPGVCVAPDDHDSLAPLVEFGRLAATSVTTQNAARRAASRVHLSGHGGTEDGIIGAAAGVGLTAWGWSGRFVEFGALRELPDPVTVGELEDLGIIVLPVDRNVISPRAEDTIATAGWLRPRLWGGCPCVPVVSAAPGHWVAIGKAALPGADQQES